MFLLTPRCVVIARRLGFGDTGVGQKEAGADGVIRSPAEKKPAMSVCRSSKSSSFMKKAC